MNSPQNPKDPWVRLVAAARATPPSGGEAAPYGFATRVAALASASPSRSRSLLERFAFRAVGVAALLAASSIAFTVSHAPVSVPSSDAQADAGTDDALSELVDA